MQTINYMLHTYCSLITDKIIQMQIIHIFFYQMRYMLSDVKLSISTVSNLTYHTIVA